MYVHMCVCHLVHIALLIHELTVPHLLFVVMVVLFVVVGRRRAC